MRQDRKIAYFKEAIEKVKSLGYKVYGYNDMEWNYAFITDGKNIGQMQVGLSGIELGTVHIGDVGWGSGFGSDKCLDPHEITEEVIKRCFSFTGGNDWANNAPIRKYKDWEHFVEKRCKPFGRVYQEL